LVQGLWKFTKRCDHAPASKPIFHTALTICRHTEFSNVQECNVSEQTVDLGPAKDCCVSAVDVERPV
jgi:hypothetical protein